jgi:hypothetical protein
MKNLKILELIKLVNDNYTHTEQLNTLITLLGSATFYDEKDLSDYVTIAKTTYNSHYNNNYTDLGVYCVEAYNNPDNHVDAVFKREYILQHGEEQYNKWYAPTVVTV